MIRPLESGARLGNIVTVTVDEPGYRLPALFMQEQGALFLTTQINGDDDKNLQTYTLLPSNAWTLVEVSQMKNENDDYNWTVRINGDTIKNVINTAPRSFNNVKIVTQGVAANVEIFNLFLDNMKGNKMTEKIIIFVRCSMFGLRLNI